MLLLFRFINNPTLWLASALSMEIFFQHKIGKKKIKKLPSYWAGLNFENLKFCKLMQGFRNNISGQKRKKMYDTFFFNNIIHRFDIYFIDWITFEVEVEMANNKTRIRARCFWIKIIYIFSWWFFVYIWYFCRNTWVKI